jgi:hypothetical protein
MMKVNGHRFSFTHLIFYISTFIIVSQLWSVWQQSAHPYLAYIPSSWRFDADLHANVHTFTNEQCDIAFPKLYRSLEQNIVARKGKKVGIEEIEISKKRCMLRLLVYGGEVR